MEFNNLDSILSCMKQWDQIRDNSSDVINYLNLGNYFSIKRNKPATPNLHAYPGISIDDNEFYMFLIDAVDDKNSSESDLFNSITVCKVEKNYSNGDEIPEAVAKERIENWKNRYADWAIAQIQFKQQTSGIFKAFNFPSDYLDENSEYATYFGLKENSLSKAAYAADLITVNISKATAVYYDTVRPVPPFDVFPETSFHLLSMI
jgi:hypothetical protein